MPKWNPALHCALKCASAQAKQTAGEQLTDLLNTALASETLGMSELTPTASASLPSTGNFAVQAHGRSSAAEPLPVLLLAYRQPLSLGDC